MAAEAPADEHRLLEPERLNDRPDGAGVAGQRVGARVFRVVRRAVAGEIDRNQTKPPAERAVELARKGARG